MSLRFAGERSCSADGDMCSSCSCVNLARPWGNSDKSDWLCTFSTCKLVNKSILPSAPREIAKPQWPRLRMPTFVAAFARHCRSRQAHEAHGVELQPPCSFGEKHNLSSSTHRNSTYEPSQLFQRVVLCNGSIQVMHESSTIAWQKHMPSTLTSVETGE